MNNVKQYTQEGIASFRVNFIVIIVLFSPLLLCFDNNEDLRIAVSILSVKVSLTNTFLLCQAEAEAPTPSPEQVIAHTKHHCQTQTGVTNVFTLSLIHI